LSPLFYAYGPCLSLNFFDGGEKSVFRGASLQDRCRYNCLLEDENTQKGGEVFELLKTEGGAAYHYLYMVGGVLLFSKGLNPPSCATEKIFLLTSNGKVSKVLNEQKIFLHQKIFLKRCFPAMPNSDDFMLESFIPLVETVATQFGANCEVALHDLRKPQESLIAISGSLTGRSLGAPITNYVLNLIKKHGDSVEQSCIYASKTSDGRRLKSSTTFIYNASGHVIGCFCINFCVEKFMSSSETLQEFCSVQDENENPGERFANDVHEVAQGIISDVMNKQSVPVERMDRSEKLDIVRELDARGLFLVKGTVEHVASCLGISKYTLYSYMDQVKESK